jgi:hypothetical protein
MALHCPKKEPFLCHNCHIFWCLRAANPPTWLRHRDQAATLQLTERTYCDLIEQFIRFHRIACPSGKMAELEMGNRSPFWFATTRFIVMFKGNEIDYYDR